MTHKRTVLITGASGGLGPAVVHRFHQDGYSVVTISRKPAAEHAEGVLHEILADALDENQVADAVKEVVGRHGRIDALVNLVGGVYPWSEIEHISLRDWEQTIALNLRTLFLMIRAVVPTMKAQETGKIVNVGANLGIQGDSHAGPYGVAKSGVINLTQTVAAECKAFNIQCNVVVPSIIDTPDNRRAMPNANVEKWVTPSKLADVIHFLCSHASDSVTGSTIRVPGRL